MGFAEDLKRAAGLLAGPEDEHVVDFLADPAGAYHALDALRADGGIVVRAAPELGVGGQGYGPSPVDPVWVRLTHGARELGTTTLRGTTGSVRRAARVSIEELETSCCDAATCRGTRTSTSVWLVLEGMGKDAGEERLLVAHDQTLGGRSRTARAIGMRLAKTIDVPLHVEGSDDSSDDKLPGTIGPALRRADIARFALRREGDRVVLRDFATAGPKSASGQTAVIGIGLALGAGLAWFQLVRVLTTGGDGGFAIGGLAALLTVAAYTFFGVARFSAKYRALSTALVAVGRDQLIVLPWVARDGAVDARPEGRLGAAVPLGDVRRACPVPRGNGVAIEIDTDHGPFDATICESEESARVWAAALNRVLDESRHPRGEATARQRARAQQETAASGAASS